jgi:hypothetical protein
MSDLLKINVNEHTEKKNNLTYLSWAWAWAEVLKIDPAATWEAHEWNGMPCMVLPDTSAMVKVSVTIKGDRKTCGLPVMDHRNKAIKNPDAFAVNTATMRCLAKAVSMHGLGLYIYAGEDLPEEEKQEKAAPQVAAANSETDEILPLFRRNELAELASFMVDSHLSGKDMDAIRVWYAEDSWSADNEVEQEERKYVWGLLKTESKLRTAIKANHPDRKAA